MDKQKQIEEIHKEYVDWALGLLKTRFDLKPEFYDEHQHDNFTYECGAESLWGKIESAMKELLWLRERQIPENAVVLTDKKDIRQFEWSKLVDKMGVIEFGEKVRKETAEKFAERLKAEAHYTVCDTRCVSVSRIDEICKGIVEGKNDGT